MFGKLCTLALVAPLASALILQTPVNPTTGGVITISWTNEPNDPETWSFELINTVFNNAFAIANNVNPSANSVTITLPVVPVGDGYTLEAVNIGNINQVYATSGSFSIGAATSTTNSGSSTGTTTTGTATTATTTSSVTGTVVTSLTTLSTAVSVSSTNTSPSTTGTGTGSATTLTPSNAGALSSRLSLNAPAGGIAVAFLSAVAGAVILAF